MAHKEQMDWMKATLAKYATDKKVDVLEIGSMDINGSIRGDVESIWKVRNYTGIDIGEGKGVDVVGHFVDLKNDVRLKTYDLVVSCEALEHDSRWRETMIGLSDVLRDGGYAILTIAGLGRPEHGTAKADGWASPSTNDYYKNVTLHGLYILSEHMNNLSFVEIVLQGTDIYIVLQKQAKCEKECTISCDCANKNKQFILDTFAKSYNVDASLIEIFKSLDNCVDLSDENNVLYFDTSRKIENIMLFSMVASGCMNVATNGINDAKLVDFCSNQCKIASYGNNIMKHEVLKWCTDNFDLAKVVVFDCANRTYDELFMNFQYVAGLINHDNCSLLFINAVTSYQKAFVRAVSGINNINNHTLIISYVCKVI